MLLLRPVYPCLTSFKLEPMQKLKFIRLVVHPSDSYYTTPTSLLPCSHTLSRPSSSQVHWLSYHWHFSQGSAGERRPLDIPQAPSLFLLSETCSTCLLPTSDVASQNCHVTTVCNNNKESYSMPTAKYGSHMLQETWYISMCVANTCL